LDTLETFGSALQIGIELLATAAFALSGITEAARKRMDVVGVCVVAFLAAFGGGTLRDILLDHRPFFWVQHQSVLIGVFSLCLLAMVFMRQRHAQLTEKAILWPDALGLGLFTASGVNQALANSMPVTVSILMGVVTGIFGGVLRDMVCNEIPATFKDHRPYALCAFAGGCCFVALHWLASPAWVSILSCVLVTVGLRALALRNAWMLPAWQWTD
jgi:uncharacterized membrane protein YeiH